MFESGEALLERARALVDTRPRRVIHSNPRSNCCRGMGMEEQPNSQAARPARRRRCILCGIALLLLAGCRGGDTHEGRGIRDLEERLERPGLSLKAVGNLANELGERYEDAGAWKKAKEHYAIAVWAYTQHQHLTGTAPLLLEDARDSLDRVAAEHHQEADQN